MPEKRVIEQAWTRLGFSADLRKTLQTLPAERALAYILHVKAEATRRPGGLCRTMIKTGIEPGPQYQEAARAMLHESHWEPAPEPGPAAAPDAPGSAPGGAPGELRADVSSLDYRPDGGRLSIRESWSATLGQLKAQLSPAAFSSYLALTEPIAYDADSSVLTLRARAVAADRWFDQHRHLIEPTLAGIAGTPIAVRVDYATRKVFRTVD